MTERYVAFTSLLLTDRAVKRSGRWLHVSLAGTNPRRIWLEFSTKAEAKLAGGSLLVHLREKHARQEIATDHQYNVIIDMWAEQIDPMIQNKQERAEEQKLEPEASKGGIGGCASSAIKT